MLQGSRRHLLVVTLLLVGVGLTWGQRWSLTAKISEDFPQAVQAPAEGASAPQIGDEIGSQPVFTYFVDVEGWYRITPFEVVVRSPFDLTAESSEAMAEALPASIGGWQQAGPDQFFADDPAIIFYLKNPTVAFQRIYENELGQQITFSIVGNRGDESFLLFSHTPETCYPGQLFQVVESRRESALLDDRPMYAQYLLTRHAQSGAELMVLYWYLWDNPQRDSRDGVLSIRVNVFIEPGQTEQAALERAWDFVRALFPVTIPWERF